MTESQEVILYGDARLGSPWVLSVWVALKEKGIPFRYVSLDLQRGEHRGDYRGRTLAGKVPSLRHGDAWISESLAILEYLEEAFGLPALLPKAPVERAKDREILSWLRSDLFELRRCLPYEGIFNAMQPPEPTEQAIEEAGALVEVASRRLAERRISLTLADHELAFTLRRLIHYGVGIEGRDDLRRWSDAIWERPSVQTWLTADRRSARAVG